MIKLYTIMLKRHVCLFIDVGKKKPHYNSKTKIVKTNMNSVTMQISRAIQNVIFYFFVRVRVHAYVNLFLLSCVGFVCFLCLFFQEKHVILLN